MILKPYDQLTRRGQLRRIRQLAETALHHYGLGGARLTFLRYFANVTYRVDLMSQTHPVDYRGPYLPNRYLLRVLLSGDREYAEGEMIWLAALSSDAGLPVPMPVATLDRELMVRVATPGLPAGRIVSLMRWVDGRRPNASLSHRQYETWGRMVGQLHAFAARWQPPAGFQRYIWDWEGLLGGRGFREPVDELVESMPEELQEPFRAASDEVRVTMDILGKGRDAFGIVHGDMYQENILFNGDRVIPIDFEDCGFGYWLWDIAIALEKNPWTESWFRNRDAFLNGYSRVHPLPDSQLKELDTFLAADYATSTLWATAFMRDDPARRSEHEAWRNRNGDKLLRYFERR